jgi:hypothetical protein
MEINCKIAMIASATFMVTSGKMLGNLFTLNPKDFARTRKKYLNRGLFLLIVAHVLIKTAFLPLTEKFGLVACKL